MRASRFFRYVWRINGVVILLFVGTLAIVVSASFLSDLARNLTRQKTPTAAQPVAQEGSEAPLKLGAPRAVAGTRILRAELVRTRPQSSYGSGSEHSETHNILFIDPLTGASSWLLKSHKNVVAYTEDISPFADDSRGERPPLATLALVKPASADEELGTGELFLFDAAGAQVASIGNKVRRVHATLAVSPAEFVVVFERDGKYHLARFDSATRRKLGEAEIKVPAIR